MTSRPQMDQYSLLKTRAVKLAQLNSFILAARNRVHHVIAISSLFNMLHPVYSQWLPLVNSSLFMLFDKLTSMWLDYRMAEFRRTAINCIPVGNEYEAAEQTLEEISQLLLTLNLPQAAKEVLTEVALAITAQTTHKLFDLNQQVYKHQLELNLFPGTLAA